jgi:hypothetical protein
MLGRLAAILLMSTVMAGAQERGSDAHVRDQMRMALDEAYRDHIAHLFKTWLSDGAEGRQRAARGVRKATEAYRQALRAADIGDLGP